MKRKRAWLFLYGLLFLVLMSVAVVAFLAESIMEYFGLFDTYTGYQRLLASAGCGGIWGLLALSLIFRGNKDEK